MSVRAWTPRSLPLRCDPVRMGQVVDNLLSNAVKYSPGGGPVFVVADREGGTVRCQVIDHGTGMGAEDREQAFGQFFRGRGARMSTVPGLGLGLAVVRSIVEQHGGTVSCESVLGEGTVLTVVLPAEGPCGGADDAGAPRRPLRAASAPALPG